MAFQTVFKRYEKKYIISETQKQKFFEKAGDYLVPDKFGKSTVCNVYFDTDDFRLIRNSIEKPVFKEKLRLRCYNDVADDSTAFVELKKKYKGVVYKRRLSIPYSDGMKWLSGTLKAEESDGYFSDDYRTRQVKNEIEAFVSFYETLHPTACLFYNREAFYCADNHELRFTFDSKIRFRTENLDLKNGNDGEIISKNENEDFIVFEIKTSDSIPKWLSDILSELRIFPNSFSKYGTVYTRSIAKHV